MSYSHIDYHDIYKLGDNLLSPSYLKNNGFKSLKGNDRFYYDAYVYKDIIKLSIVIDISENGFTYEVTNNDWKILYAPFYSWDGGRNLMLEEVNRNIKKEFTKLYKKNILSKKSKTETPVK